MLMSQDEEKEFRLLFNVIYIRAYNKLLLARGKKIAGGGGGGKITS